MWRYTEAVASLFILWTFIPNSCGWRPFTINISNVSSITYSDKFYANLTMNENNALSFVVQIKEEVSNPTVRSEIYLQSPETGQYDVELMNRTIHVCRLFSNKVYEPLLQIIFRIIQDYGKIPNRCPIKVSSYRVVNLKPDADRFPMYLPERKGVCTLTFFKNGNFPIGQTIAFFEVKSKAGKRFKVA